MKTLVIYEFTRQFARHQHEPCLVKKRGTVIGQWVPVPKTPQPIDVMARLRKTFSRKLPFTGVELLKEGKNQ